MAMTPPSPNPDLPSRVRGCLLAGAAGDALGAPVEFMSLSEIRGTFGPGGVRDLAPAYGRSGGAVTDDTQMTLFTAEGLLRAHGRDLLGGPPSLAEEVGHAYQRWLLTQGRKGRCDVRRDGWLFNQQDLFAVRAPGNTCISALAAAVDGPARNDSKGCGGVMRAAPAGLYAAALKLPSRQAFAWGCQVAALTHGHPTGQLPAGFLAMAVGDLAQGLALRATLARATEALLEHPAHGETLHAVQRAERLAASALPAEGCLAMLGEGWVAEEALAIALFCALRAESLEEGVIMAANLTGDSDSTASITGNLLGAHLGAEAIPVRWLENLELKAIITTLAEDLATVSAWAAPGQGPWNERYPG